MSDRPDLAAAIRRALDEYDSASEKAALREELDELKGGRKLTKEELREVLGSLSDDERDELVSALVGEERWKAASVVDELDDGGDPKPAAEPAAPAKPTRAGRKRGGLYEYEVDEKGKVVPSDVGIVYTGDDEPDVVELPPDEDEAAA